jgi:predicted amidophosphoribosyltransferase
VGLSAGARRRNVAGAFSLKAGKGAKIAGKHVLLVDDVLTTGATVEACTRVLLKEGAAMVSVLTIARVAGEEAPPI